jgi:hypothetical protein
VKGGRSIRNLSLMNSGTLSPNPWDLTPWGPNDCSTLKALERRIGLRRDATRAPFKGLNGRGGWTTVAPTLTYATRRSLAYWKPKMVLTTGATLPIRIASLAIKQHSRLITFSSASSAYPKNYTVWMKRIPRSSVGSVSLRDVWWGVACASCICCRLAARASIAGISTAILRWAIGLTARPRINPSPLC